MKLWELGAAYEHVQLDEALQVRLGARRILLRSTAAPTD
jgi:hypothetical protein